MDKKTSGWTTNLIRLATKVGRIFANAFFLQTQHQLRLAPKVLPYPKKLDNVLFTISGSWNGNNATITPNKIPIIKGFLQIFTNAVLI